MKRKTSKKDKGERKTTTQQTNNAQTERYFVIGRGEVDCLVIPSVIVWKIFHFLPVGALFNFSQSCSVVYQIFKSHEISTYAHLCDHTFGTQFTSPSSGLNLYDAQQTKHNKFKNYFIKRYSFSCSSPRYANFLEQMAKDFIGLYKERENRGWPHIVQHGRVTGESDSESDSGYESENSMRNRMGMCYKSFSLLFSRVTKMTEKERHKMDLANSQIRSKFFVGYTHILSQARNSQIFENWLFAQRKPEYFRIIELCTSRHHEVVVTPCSTVADDDESHTQEEDEKSYSSDSMDFRPYYKDKTRFQSLPKHKLFTSTQPQLTEQSFSGTWMKKIFQLSAVSLADIVAEYNEAYELKHRKPFKGKVDDRSYLLYILLLHNAFHFSPLGRNQTNLLISKQLDMSVRLTVRKRMKFFFSDKDFGLLGIIPFSEEEEDKDDTEHDIY